MAIWIREYNDIAKWKESSATGAQAFADFLLSTVRVMFRNLEAIDSSRNRSLILLSIPVLMGVGW